MNLSFRMEACVVLLKPARLLELVFFVERFAIMRCLGEPRIEIDIYQKAYHGDEVYRGEKLPCI